jgi:DNA-binding MarR family transcriptional regulator
MDTDTKRRRGPQKKGAVGEGDGADAGVSATAGRLALNPLSITKIWYNPLIFSHRLNTVAAYFNVPVYDWVEKRFGLTRPQFVVLYSVYLRNGSTAHDICVSSVFPKNTISRAVVHVSSRKLLESHPDPDDNRRLLLNITPKGLAIIEKALPMLLRQEDLMLAGLTPRERRRLEVLLERVIVTQGGAAAAVIAREARAKRKSEAAGLLSDDE